jgi:hypothetical protein
LAASNSSKGSLDSSAENSTILAGATMNMAGHMHGSSHDGPQNAAEGPAGPSSVTPTNTSTVAPPACSTSMRATTPGRTNVSTVNPEICNPWQHFVTVCKLDEGMGGMAGEICNRRLPSNTAAAAHTGRMRQHRPAAACIQPLDIRYVHCPS